MSGPGAALRSYNEELREGERGRAAAGPGRGPGLTGRCPQGWRSCAPGGRS